MRALGGLVAVSGTPRIPRGWGPVTRSLVGPWSVLLSQHHQIASNRPEPWRRGLTSRFQFGQPRHASRFGATSPALGAPSKRESLRQVQQHVKFAWSLGPRPHRAFRCMSTRCQGKKMGPGGPTRRAEFGPQQGIQITERSRPGVLGEWEEIDKAAPELPTCHMLDTSKMVISRGQLSCIVYEVDGCLA